MTQIMKVVFCGEMFTVKSEKSENGQLNKRIIVLQELGGKYENRYCVSVLGNLAQCQWYADDLVVAVLRFQTHEVNGQYYQDVTASDILKLK
ncbi:MAG: DUF3127 domain-containing protein [Prevotella sp.]|nr:DUF3127 domain-containing protein [Prevotella sp.]